MNPNHNEQPVLSLPAPSYELKEGVVPAEAPHLKQAASPEAIKLSNQPPSLSISNDTQQTNPLVPLVNPTPSPGTSNVPATNAPAIANDVDLIEKEWVIKAKQIVDSNKEDPYMQNKEINRFKADYIKKRYNKSIKVADE